MTAKRAQLDCLGISVQWSIKWTRLGGGQVAGQSDVALFNHAPQFKELMELPQQPRLIPALSKWIGAGSFPGYFGGKRSPHDIPSS